MYKKTIISIKNIFQRCLKKVSDLLFPVMCILCKKGGEYLCINCENNLELSSKKINTWTYAKYKYKNKNLQKIEYAIKYNHHPELGTALGEYSYEYILNKIIKEKIQTEHESLNDLQNIFLIPIPISKERLKERGYNQTMYIAKGICTHFTGKENYFKSYTGEVKMLDILNKENTTKLKSLYGIDNRLEEVKNKISVNREKVKSFLKESEDIKSENDLYILIDDITTTGATFYEARRALVEYGIIEKNIYAYSLAH